MALLFPILIGLVFNFIGIMLVVVEAAQLQSAASLAASAAIQVDLGGVSPTSSSPLTAQTLYQETFNGTFGCAGGEVAGNCTPSWAFASMSPGQQITCHGQYLGNGSTPYVTCTASVTLNMSASPVGFGLFGIHWTPTLSATAEAYPSSVRYCGTGGACP
jgi:Flp pilus assembly protein TadG